MRKKRKLPKNNTVTIYPDGQKGMSSGKKRKNSRAKKKSDGIKKAQHPSNVEYKPVLTVRDVMLRDNQVY